MTQDPSLSLFERTKVRWPLAAVLVLIVAWGTWSTPILSHNEARRMVVAQEILRAGHWLLPTMNGELYVTKPPLYTWLQAAFGWLFQSTSPGVLRLPSILAALVLFWLLHRFMRRHAGEEAAWFAVLVLGTSQLFIMHARSAELEMLLTLFNTAALLFGWEFVQSGRKRWLLLAHASLALAVLTKGPVALLFFVPPVLWYGVFVDRRALRCLASPLAWGLFLLVALPWYLYVYSVVDAETIRQVLHRDLVGKMKGRHSAPLYTYLAVILGGFLPWLLVLFTPAARPSRRLRQPGIEAWLAWGALVPVLIMSAFSAKHGKYILPVFPLLAGWLGLLLARWAARSGEGGRRWLGIVAVVMLIGTALFHLFLAPVVWQHRYIALEPIVAEARRHDLPLFAMKQRPIQLIYYYGKPIPVLEEEGIAARRRQGEAFLLLVDSRYWKSPALEGAQPLRQWPVYLKKKRGVRLYRLPAGSGQATD